MKKKPTKRKRTKSLSKSAIKQPDKEFQSYLTNNKLFLVMIVIALIYWAFSYISTGMYQGEEGSQYVNMKEFWYNPHVILGNWAKPGWKIIYVLPALLGYKFVQLFTALISSTAGIVGYKVAKKMGVNAPWLVIVLLFSQFFWFHLAFRNFSELLSALIIISAILTHYNHKYLVSGLLVSFLIIIRQEWVPFVAIYGLYFLYKRQFVAAFSIALFPVIINIWGWFVTGDPLYLINNALNTSESYSSRYPRLGFDNYLKVSLPLFGPLCLFGLLGYFISLTEKRFKPDYLMIVPFAGFFLMMCLFNLKSPEIGTATGGNWRYLLAILPVAAVLATIGWERMIYTTSKLKYIISGIILALMLISFSAYKHNYIMLNNERDMILVLAVIITLVFLLIPFSYKSKILGILGLAILFNLMYIRPKEIMGENKAIKELIPWLNEQNLEQQKILNSNSVINFYWDKTKYDFPKGYERISEEAINESPPGTYIFWESHFTKRYSGLDYQYFQDKPEKFQLVKQVVSDDKRFVLLIYQKKA